jgi:hypothetical protein
MNQLTLRQIPEPLESKLRDFARREGTSLNKSIIVLLKRALGTDKEHRVRRDLSFLAGSWSEEESREFDANTRVFEEIDPELWQ